ncbi:MAG TPA: asparagine synthase (glutamine-hydrolyzing) [Acidimicrobiales bacterium]|nr:asparagine synthase (glutamine-hydrolyzing) [Acidimicrobiales bacterium]
MCGIAGVVAPYAGRHAGAVDAMLAALRHRGPDGTGVVDLGGCVLGATRLAVMDLDRGAQPMVHVDGTSAVAFNGEVYGHRRLRDGLRYPFRTTCDTEVLLALHDARGERFVEDLPGMFAYALWDGRRGRLLCGRDRFGEKPFFWTRGPDGAFAFASEVGALLASGFVDEVVDEVALAHHLAHARIPTDRSIFRDIHVLAPAHRLAVRSDGTPSDPVRYWKPPPRWDAMDAAVAAEDVRGALDVAVADQLVADVPVGAFLSGGLDSGSVVAAAAPRHPQLHTFSLGFGGPGDETAAAEAQAEHLGTVHHAVRPADVDKVAFLRRLARVYGEPHGDASAIPTLLLSEAAREHVTVALTGDGADELLGGYLYWSRHHLAHQDVPLPRSLGGPGPDPTEPGRLLAAYRGFRRYLDDDRLAALGVVLPPPSPPSSRATGTVSDLLLHDLEGYLPGGILVKTDRASMAVGLELRSPFLDRRVAELCLSLPETLLVDRHGDKLVLRAAMAERLAPGVVERDKRGFAGPMAAWLGDPVVADYGRELLAPLASLIEPEAAAAVLDGGGQAAWNVLVLGVWAEARPRARR